MKHIWSILCHKAVVDRNTNTLSVFDMVEEISIALKSEGLKYHEVKIPSSFTLVNFISNFNASTNRKGSIIIEIKNHNKKIISKLKREFEMKKGIRRIRIITVLPELTLNKKDNNITFIIKLKSEKDSSYKKVAEIPLDINFVKLPVDNSSSKK